MDERGQGAGNLQHDQKKARSLYSKTTKLEKQLTSELKKTHNPVDEQITQLRNKVKENYEQVIFLDFDFAASKDIDQLLWKSVFYKPIEQFRKLIKKTNSNKNTDSAKQIRNGNIIPAFRSFLNEATEYYKSLFSRLEKLQSSGHGTKILPSLHKCQIILGDLARYKELYNEGGKRDFSTAKEHYFKALGLLPQNGNPHNQLAVLATYDEDECEAIYRYFRSLSVQKPFISARENLILLFEKNRQRTQMLQTNPDKASKIGLLKRFKLRFVRLHGIIFTKTGMEMFNDTLNTALEDLRQLLETETLPNEFSLKLSVMNIFSIVNAKCPPDGSTSSEPDEEKRKLLLAAATSLAYSTIIEVMEYVLEGKSQLLRAVVPLIQWICHNYSEFDLDKLGNNEELKGMLSLLVQLLNKFKLPRGTIESLQSDSISLPEDSELQGFLPLNFSIPEKLERPSTPNDQIDYFVRLFRLRNAVRPLYEMEPPLLYYNESQDVFSLESSVESPPPASQDKDTVIENADVDHANVCYSPEDITTSNTVSSKLQQHQTSTNSTLSANAQHPASDFLSKEFFNSRADNEQNEEEEEEEVIVNQPPEPRYTRDMNRLSSSEAKYSTRNVRAQSNTNSNPDSIVQPFTNSKIEDNRNVTTFNRRHDTNSGVIGQLKLNQTSTSPFGNSLFGSRSQMLFGNEENHVQEDDKKKSSSLFSNGSIFSWGNQQNIYQPGNQRERRDDQWNNYPNRQQQYQFQYQQHQPQQQYYQNSFNWGYNSDQFHPNFVQEQSHMFYNPNNSFSYQQQKQQQQHHYLYQQQQQQQQQYMHQNSHFDPHYSSPSYPMTRGSANNQFAQPMQQQQQPVANSPPQQQHNSEHQVNHPHTRNPFV